MSLVLFYIARPCLEGDRGSVRRRRLGSSLFVACCGTFSAQTRAMDEYAVHVDHTVFEGSLRFPQEVLLFEIECAQLIAVSLGVEAGGGRTLCNPSGKNAVCMSRTNTLTCQHRGKNRVLLCSRDISNTKFHIAIWVERFT